MKIAGVDTSREVFIVAEIGNNHEGDFELAKRQIREAAKTGVHAVKFQTFKTELYVSPLYDEARFKRLKRYELSHAQFRELAELARRERVAFLSSPFDLESARFLDELVPALKIASGDNDFFPLLRVVAGTGKPVLLSSGLSDLPCIANSKRFIEGEWKKNGIRQEMAVLHCVSAYPVPAEEASLASISFLKQRLGGTIGYSDHTLGIEACVFAAAMGARVIEKHFTLDKNQSDFRDHQLSADPLEMSELVRRVRALGVLSGRPEKIIRECEKPNLGLMRRSIAARRDLPEGAALSESDLMWIRPGTGIPPGGETACIGRILKRPVRQGEILTPEHLVSREKLPCR